MKQTHISQKKKSKRFKTHTHTHTSGYHSKFSIRRRNRLFLSFCQFLHTQVKNDLVHGHSARWLSARVCSSRLGGTGPGQGPGTQHLRQMQLEIFYCLAIDGTIQGGLQQEFLLSDKRAASMEAPHNTPFFFFKRTEVSKAFHSSSIWGLRAQRNFSSLLTKPLFSRVPLGPAKCQTVLNRLSVWRRILATCSSRGEMIFKESKGREL